MEEVEITIGDKKYIIKEIKYKDIALLGKIEPAEAAKKMIQLSMEMTDEEYDNLSMKEGLKLTNEINKLNGVDENFQASQPKDTTK